MLHDQAADVWCLTEVPPQAIADGWIVGYPAVGSTGLVVAPAALPHWRPGSLSIDHIAVPVSWRVVAAHRIVADRLSDHDAYVVDAEPGVHGGGLAHRRLERVTRLFPGPDARDSPALFAGKCFPDRLDVHAVDGDDLRGRSMAGHHSDA